MPRKRKQTETCYALYGRCDDSAVGDSNQIAAQLVPAMNAVTANCFHRKLVRWMRRCPQDGPT